MDIIIDAQEYIDEIVVNIKSKDKIKADIVMSHIANMDHFVQEKMLEELSKVNNSFTVNYLIHLVDISQNLKLTEEEISITLQDMIVAQPQNLLSLFENRDKIKSIDIIDLAAVVQYEKVAPFLVEMLNETTDKTRLLKIIDALGAIGSPCAITSISEYLYSIDKDLTFAALRALKEIGTAETVEVLSKRLGSDHEIDVFIVDTLVSFQNEHALNGLINILKTHNPKIRNYAKTKLIQIGPKVVPLLSQSIEEETDTEFIIHVLNVLGVVGDESGVTSIRQLLFNEPKNSNVRFAAYEALGMLPLKKGMYILSQGLSDPEEQVRNAAARAIDKNNNSVLQAGIQNLIHDESVEARKIVSAFINSESDSIFKQLFLKEPFQSIAMHYLKSEAHPDIKKHYYNIINLIGYTDLADEIATKDESDENKLKICVVDDSRMLLKVYKSSLHDIGYDSMLFEFPESALEHITNEKPDLVITDLNMPKITGIELTKRLRDVYSKKQLPIILITTQTDEKETKQARDAGISSVIYKPFKKEDLKNEIEKLTQK